MNDLKKQEYVKLLEVKQQQINKLFAESKYYRNQLSKSHELLGRITHQLSERWDTVNLTKYFPTDNLHGKKSSSNPTGESDQ